MSDDNTSVPSPSPQPLPPLPRGVGGVENELGSGATTGTLEIMFSKTLSLEIPRSEPPSSVTSSRSSSPTGILDSRSTSSSESSSLLSHHLTPATSGAAASAGEGEGRSDEGGTGSASGSGTTSPVVGMNVKFAPLPQLAPRKRRSSVPLGMAARSQLVRRRRGGGYHDPEQGPRYNAGSNPTWTEEELAQARTQQVAAAMEKERQRREAADAPVDPNDPLVVLGKKVKDASRQIWKKVSKKDMKKEKDKYNEKEKENAMVVEGMKEGGIERKSNGSVNGEAPQVALSNETSNGSQEGGTPSLLTPASSTTTTPVDRTPPLRSILVTSQPPTPITPATPAPTPEPAHSGKEEEEEEERGGVWEEEIDPHFPLHASQNDAAFDTGATPLSTKRSNVWTDSQHSGITPSPAQSPSHSFINADHDQLTES